MTTVPWSSALDHTSDAGFRAWGAEYNAKLAAAGLVQASDTGQINWASVNRPGISTVAGYEIWRFNDALQATAPIYIKLEFGTGTNASVPQLWITVGTGSNGSGTITGQSSTRTICGTTGNPGVAATSYPSYACHAEGHFGISYKQGWHTLNMTPGTWFLHRYSDDDGTPNGDGFVVYMVSNANSAATASYLVPQSVRTAATATTFTAATNTGTYALWPHGLSNPTLDAAGDVQIVPYFYPTKRLQQSFALCAVDVNEIATAATFSVALKGASARTFISLGNGGGLGGIGNTNARGAMLWE